MKNFSFSMLLFAGLSAFAFSTELYANDSGLYVGLGGSYASESFDVDVYGDVVYGGDEMSAPAVDFCNTWAINAKIGYHFNKLYSLEFDYDNFPDFDGEGLTHFGPVVNVDAEMEVMTFMVMFKLSPNIKFEKLRPFIVAGVGAMHSEIEAKSPDGELSEPVRASQTDPCAKLGLGMDFFVTENVSIGVEGSYLTGIGDLDDVRYTNYILGVTYHFF